MRMYTDIKQCLVQNKLPGCHLRKSEIDEECGCLEEEWETPVGFMSFHLLPQGIGEVFFDNGDAGEWEVTISGSGEVDFRRKLELYILDLGKRCDE